MLISLQSMLAKQCLKNAMVPKRPLWFHIIPDGFQKVYIVANVTIPL